MKIYENIFQVSFKFQKSAYNKQKYIQQKSNIKDRFASSRSKITLPKKGLPLGSFTDLQLMHFWYYIWIRPALRSRSCFFNDVIYQQTARFTSILQCIVHASFVFFPYRVFSEAKLKFQKMRLSKSALNLTCTFFSSLKGCHKLLAVEL